MNLFQGKKAVGLLIITGIVFLISTIIVLMGLSSDTALESTSGVKQYSLLYTNEQLEAAQVYYDEALPYSAQLAKEKLFRTSGIEADEYFTGTFFLSPCRNHIYPLYNNRDASCFPSFRTTYKNYVKNSMMSYTRAYEPFPLDEAYAIDLVGSDIRLISPSIETVSIDTKTQFTKEQKISPSGKLGGYANEIETPCYDGECFAQVAEYYHELYALSGFKFNYVYGGESPYDYELTLSDQENNPRSIFKDVELSQIQSGRSTLTEAGFDDSGWVWWVARHAKIPQLYQRKSIVVQQEAIDDEQYTICSKIIASLPDCTQDLVLTQAQRGDIIIVGEDTLIEHIMIYLGDNKVSHSREGVGLVLEDIPLKYLTADTSKIIGVYRLQYPPRPKDKDLPKDNTVLFGSVEDTKIVDAGTDCLIPMDFSQIKTESFRPARANVVANPLKHINNFEKALASTNQRDSLQEAANKFPNMPLPFIKAIMFTEIYQEGGQTEKFLLGEVDQSGKNIVGPMQIGNDACNDVNTNLQQSICNYNAIKKGSYEGAKNGILSGTAYLDILPQLTSNINEQKINYYFLALAYNAGIGTLNDVLEHAHKRTKIPKADLQWKDITKEDIDAGVPSDWGEVKKEEVFEYPNFVAQMTSYQCDGDAFAQYRTYDSTMNFQPLSTTDIPVNLGNVNKLKLFYDDVLTCDDNLELCVNIKVDEFNKAHDKNIIHIRQKEEQYSVAYDFADELLNCYYNEQTNCNCKFDTEGFQTTDFTDDTNTIRFSETGRIDIGMHSSLNDDFYVKEEIAYVPFTPNRIESIHGEKTSEKTGDIAITYDTGKKTYSLQKIKSGFDYDPLVVGEDIDSLALSKRGEFSVEVLSANEQQRQLVAYAKKYLGSGYGDTGECSATDASAGRCTTQCGSFSTNAFRFGLQLRGNDLPATNYGKDKCTHPSVRVIPKGAALQPGDLFASSGNSDAGKIAGHTGMFVGKGRVENVVKTRSNGEPYCYGTYIEDPLGEDVFIHSVGPVCYNTLSQLTKPISEGGQGRTIIDFCRSKLLDKASDDEAKEVPLQWIEYDEEKNANDLCRDNKHYFRFQAEFKNEGHTMDFSIYLDDTQSPKKNVKTSTNKRLCAGEDVGILEWEVESGEERIFSFDIEIKDGSGGSETFTLNESGALTTDVDDSSKLNIIHQLYKKATKDGTKYYYLFNTFNDAILQPATTYEYQVTPMDHYKNVGSASESASLSIPQRDLTQFSYVSILTDVAGKVINIASSSGEGGDVIETPESFNGQSVGSLFQTFTHASSGFIGGLFSVGECKDAKHRTLPLDMQQLYMPNYLIEGAPDPWGTEDNDESVNEEVILGGENEEFSVVPFGSYTSDNIEELIVKYDSQKTKPYWYVMEKIYSNPDAKDAYHIIVDGETQRAYLVHNKDLLHSYTVSTGEAGFGNADGSGKTPLGLIKVEQIIGDTASSGKIPFFKSQKKAGETTISTSVSSGYYDTDGDGLKDELELLFGLNPRVKDVVDTDKDGLADVWEMYYFHNLNKNGGSQGPDTDKQRARAEYYKARDPTKDDKSGDYITSRLITLVGKEDINSRTFSRWIYLHGTNEEPELGKPRSAGCIRFTNEAIIDLADKYLSSNSYIYIAEDIDLRAKQPVAGGNTP